MREELLLAYFDRLIIADKTGYICHREIAEVIKELRYELGITDAGKELDIALKGADLRVE